MNTLDSIFSRRSVRHYTDEMVSEDNITTILAAAMAAPSAGNVQEWHFVVITDRDKLNEIPNLNEYASMAETAPLAILVCADTKKERFAGFWEQDCSAAMQNILLTVTELGLGAVWTGIHPVEERKEAYKKAYALPQGVEPFGLVVIGHPAHSHKEHSRIPDPAKIHRNMW